MASPVDAGEMNPRWLHASLEQAHQKADRSETGKVGANSTKHNHDTPEEQIDRHKLSDGELLQEIVGWPR